MFIYPENLKAKPKLWLWQLRDISIIGICMILSALALAQGVGMAPLVLTFLDAFLAIQVEDASILDFLRKAACFLFLQQQFYEWRLDRGKGSLRGWTREKKSSGINPPGSSWGFPASPIMGYPPLTAIIRFS